MNYDRYYTCDVVNGEGLRVTLFVTGCAHACPGCHNRSCWDRKTGQPFSDAVRERLLDLCADHDGLSLSGGDPLLPANREAITELCRRFKARYPDKDIWMWTGYLYEDVQHLEVMRYVDVLIDGPYLQNEPNTLPWRGSDNQRLIRLADNAAFGLNPPTQAAAINIKLDPATNAIGIAGKDAFTASRPLHPDHAGSGNPAAHPRRSSC